MTDRHDEPYNKSLYPHERQALKQIWDALEEERKNNQILLYPCFEYLKQTNRAIKECDLIVLSKSFFSVVELKHYSGTIDIIPGSIKWINNGKKETSPHKTNSLKLKSYASYLDKALQKTFRFSFEIPRVQSILLLTHPSVLVTNADTPENCKNKDNNYLESISFSGVHNLLKYLKIRLNEEPKANKLTEDQFLKIKQVMDFESQDPEKYYNQLKGFKIIEDISRSELYDEYLASPSDDNFIDNKLKKIRIWSLNPEFIEKQKHNLSTLQKMDPHPNIVSVNYTQEDGVVTEICNWSEIGTLRNLLDKDLKKENSEEKPKLDWEKYLKIFQSVLRGIEHLQKSGIVHRNLKPENVLVSEDGKTVQIINFDLAFVPDSDYTSMTTEEKQIITPYRAPELFDGKTSLKTDIYSLGVILFEILYGEVPIKSFNDLESFNQKFLSGDFKTDNFDENMPGHIKEKLKNLILNSLDVNPDNRPEVKVIISTIDKMSAAEKPLPTSNNQELEINGKYKKYKILEKLGKGSVSQVYKAIKFEEQVTLKLFNIEVQEPDLLNERTMLMGLNSPYIARFRNLDEWVDGRQFIELDFVEGNSLKEEIENKNKPDLEKFKTYTVQLLEALIYLHQADKEEENRTPKIHNDLNPSNILIGPQGAKIIDFSVASFPGIGSYCGTHKYIAPDLIVDGSLNRCESGDMFSLAVTLFQWLTGEHPFKGNLPGLYKSEIEFSEEINDKLKKWFNQALAKSSELRFISAKEMLEDFYKTFEKDEIEDLPKDVIKNISEETNNVLREAQLSGNHIVEDFVNYLNSLSNITGNNENALAESQAVNRFFGEVYVKPPITEEIYDLLTKKEDIIIILTGHAGDGKSTIALDIFKRLKGLSPKKELDKALEEKEYIEDSKVTIVKDMSELSDEDRKKVVRELLAKEGKGLIISNTGPLVNTLSELKEDNRYEIEDKVLKILERKSEKIDERLILKDFSKKIVIINLTMLDNISVAENILRNIINVPYWGNCNSCPAEKNCPIIKNVNALKDSDLTIDRLMLIYRYLVAYNQRLTLRQLSGHIAHSLTGGNSCGDVKREILETDNFKDFVSKNLISNTFFGFKGRKPDEISNELFIVRVLKPFELGSRVFSPIDKNLYEKETLNFIKFPLHLKPEYEDLLDDYHAKVIDSFNNSDSDRLIRYRQQIRRFFYTFVDIGQIKNELNSEFINTFFRSPKLEEVENWLKLKNIPRDKQKNLRRSALEILLEEYTGFPYSQFSANQDRLYLTLKREDKNIYQSVQLILKEISFDDFEIYFNPELREIRLYHIDQKDPSYGLNLTLPLIDYITLKSGGEVVDKLDETYKNHLESFKAKLLKLKNNRRQEDSFKILQCDIEGKMKNIRVEVGEREIELS
jgi:serine/threonine protein kinase